MSVRKWFVVVPFPLPAAMETLLESMPGWGRGPTFGTHELLTVLRQDLRDALVQAGAVQAPHHSRSAAAIPSAVATAAGFSTAGATVADFFSRLFGDDSWAD